MRGNRSAAAAVPIRVLFDVYNIASALQFQTTQTHTHTHIQSHTHKFTDFRLRIHFHILFHFKYSDNKAHSHELEFSNIKMRKQHDNATSKHVNNSGRWHGSHDSCAEDPRRSQNVVAFFISRIPGSFCDTQLVQTRMTKMLDVTQRSTKWWLNGALVRILFPFCYPLHEDVTSPHHIQSLSLTPSHTQNNCTSMWLPLAFHIRLMYPVFNGIERAHIQQTPLK